MVRIQSVGMWGHWGRLYDVVFWKSNLNDFASTLSSTATSHRQSWSLSSAIVVVVARPCRRSGPHVFMPQAAEARIWHGVAGKHKPLIVGPRTCVRSFQNLAPWVVNPACRYAAFPVTPGYIVFLLDGCSISGFSAICCQAKALKVGAQF